jgi:predicted CoA-binding protein
MNDAELRRLLEDARTIAVVGASPRTERPSNSVSRYLLAQGFHILPVNPTTGEVLGLTCYPNLKSVPEPVDVVNVFRRPEHVPAIVEEAVEIGARAVWMQLGVMNAEAATRAEAAGLLVVMNRCIAIEHQRLAVAPIAPEELAPHPHR